MSDVRDERGDVGAGDGVWSAGSAVESRAGTPVLDEGDGESGVNEFERSAAAILGHVRFPTEMAVSGDTVSRENARRPVAIVSELQLTDGLAGGVFELAVVADRAGPP